MYEMARSAVDADVDQGQASSQSATVPNTSKKSHSTSCKEAASDIVNWD